MQILKSYFLEKDKLIHLIFYILSAGLIVYAYNIRVLFLLILFVFSIFTCSGFLVELYLLIRGRLQTKKDFIITLLLLSIIVPLCFIFLNLKVVLYIVVLSVMVAVVSLYRNG